MTNTSDPFNEVNDVDLKKAHILRQRHMLKDNLIKHMSRGNYNLRWLQDRFSNDLFDDNAIESLVHEVAEEIILRDGTTDLRLEVSAYLATNNELKRTLFDMLDGSAGEKPRTVVEIVKAISALDKDRIDFMKWAGLAPKKRANSDPNIVSANDFDILEDEADTHEQRFGKNGQPRAIEGKVEAQ